MEKEDLFHHMREWDAFVRRHHATIFDVLFKDVDHSLYDEELNSIIADVARFFGLDLPVITNHCDTLAKMQLQADGKEGSELFYNWQLLQTSGINNRDAFTLCMVHEIAHLYFKDTRFLLCRNERWCHELAADFVVGIYSAIKNMATGKYKYVVGQLPATVTHPHGKHRAAAVEFARECVTNYSCDNIDEAIMGLPAFVYGLQRILNEELTQCTQELEKKNVNLQNNKIDIEALPDSNLLKQAIKKYR